ncbi:MAG: hypothetical protein H7X86_02070 [Gorillibacterium sp.]|nr:hypothetical protein [Gorillibacterium sp.]
MNKKLISAVLVLSLAAFGSACSSTAKEGAASTAPTAIAEDANMFKAHAYVAARMAEEKIAVLFQSKTTEDGKAIMNANAAADKAEATEFLNTYLDPALTEKVLTHFLTEEKAGEATVVNTEPFVPVSILATKSKDEVTFEGDANEVKLITKDGGVFIAKKTAEASYIITDITKQ